MASTVKHGLQNGSLSDVKRTHSLRRVQLVAGDREQIACDALYFDWHLPCRLHRVGMEIHIRFGGDLSNLLDGLQDAGFVVCHHDRDQLCVWAQGAADVVGIDQAATVDGNVGDFASHGLEMLAGVQHRMMFDGRTDYMVPGAGQARDGQIVSLGAAAGEDDFRSPATK